VQKKDQVVVAGHFLGSEGLYGNDELELAGDACAVAIQGGHVFGVGVDEVDRAPALSHQCADEDDRLQAGDTAEEGVIEGVAPLLAYTETREDFAQQVVAGELAGDGTQRLMCKAQFFGKEVEHLVVMFGMFASPVQVLARLFKRTQMAFAGQPGRLCAGRPAGDIEQPPSQLVEIVTGFGRDIQSIFFRRVGARRRVDQVDLVDDRENRRARGQALRDLNLEFVGGVARVLQVYDDVGTFDLGPCAGDADALHLVVGFPQTSRIYDVYWYAIDVNLLNDAVARRAGDRGHNGDVVACKCIQQARLAHVGPPGEHDVQAFAQNHALACVAPYGGQVGDDAVQCGFGLVFFQKVDFFFGKVERGFHQHAQVNDALVQFAHRFRECTAERGHGAARGRFRWGIDEVGHCFGLSKVEPVVQKRALRELARLRMAHSPRAARLDAMLQHTAQH